MSFQEKEQKLLSSEATVHERVSPASRKKKMEGYDENPKEERPDELFGLKNSFDNLSVGKDSKGRITVAVSSQKGFHSKNLDSGKKKLKGSRKRTAYEHFVEFYTNSYSATDGAFAFKTRRDLSENRILHEMRDISARRISEQQREALPFLSLEDDRKHLTELRTAASSDPAALAEKQSAENVIAKKTEAENRFIRRLRIARNLTGYHPDDSDFLLSPLGLISAQDNIDESDEDESDDQDNSPFSSL